MNFERYYPTGDLFWDIYDRYGADAANRVYFAAQTGDITQLNAALASVSYGVSQQSDSSGLWSNFWRQITTDPLAAPLDSANNQLGLAFKNFFKSPWVVLTAALVVFYLLGGFDYLRRKINP